MKVIHFTTVHPPTDVRVFGREGRSLLQAGYDLTLIAPRPADDRYPEGVSLRFVPNEKTRVRQITFGAWRMFRELRRTDADLYHFHDPDLLPVALWLCYRRKRVIYDAHENTSFIVLTANWIPAAFRRVVGFCFRHLEDLAASKMTAIVTANDAISQRFYGLNARVVRVSNYPLLSDFATRAAPEPGQIVAFGGIGDRTCVDQVIVAVESVAASRHIELVLAGRTFSPELLEHIKTRPGWSSVRFLGSVPRNVLLQELRKAAVSLVLYSPEPNHYGVGSNRFFESLAAGVPVITSNFPAWRDIVEEVGCGLTVDPTDPSAIASAIEYLLGHPKEAEEMGRLGQQAFLEKFNWDREQQVLLELYKDLIGPGELSYCSPDPHGDRTKSQSIIRSSEP